MFSDASVSVDYRFGLCKDFKGFAMFRMLLSGCFVLAIFGIPSFAQGNPPPDKVCGTVSTQGTQCFNEPLPPDQECDNPFCVIGEDTCPFTLDVNEQNPTYYPPVEDRVNGTWLDVNPVYCALAFSCRCVPGAGQNECLVDEFLGPEVSIAGYTASFTGEECPPEVIDDPGDVVFP